ncbi:MAG: hypothetical protein DWI22_10925 [Planctomycetota bacterium]|nr:MAG: hypothetical protein DWI22_10925 [Planctomycetota bacterium]
MQTGSNAAMHCGQADSTTHLYAGTVVVTVFFINFRFVKISPLLLGIQDVHTRFFGAEETSPESGLGLQMVSLCWQSGVLGPGTQKSSHFMPQQVVVIFLFSLTSRQIWRQRLATQPQCAQQPSSAMATDEKPAPQTAEKSETSSVRRVDVSINIT